MIKKFFIPTTLLLFLVIANQTVAQDADGIKGKWYNSDKDAQIEIFKEGGKYYGKIVWLKEPTEDGKSKIDKNNSDKSKQNRPIMGLRILNDFQYTGKDTWENGTIYDPKNGKNYNCNIRIKNSNTLEVRGFIGISLIGRTVIWTRVELGEGLVK